MRNKARRPTSPPAHPQKIFRLTYWPDLPILYGKLFSVQYNSFDMFQHTAQLFNSIISEKIDCPNAIAFQILRKGLLGLIVEARRLFSGDLIQKPSVQPVCQAGGQCRTLRPHKPQLILYDHCSSTLHNPIGQNSP